MNINSKTQLWCITLILLMALAGGCSKGKDKTQKDKGEKDKGKNAGPDLSWQIKEVKLGPLNKENAEKGKKVFELKCIACHKIDKVHVGPPMKGVTKRRKPAWILNIIMHPDEMLKVDPIFKKLQEKHNYAIMTNQNISKEDALLLLEYFRQIDSK